MEKQIDTNFVLKSGLRPNSGLRPKSDTKLCSKTEVNNLNNSVLDQTIIMYLDSTTH